MNDEAIMRRCYELAVRAGKKGHDTFGAVLARGGEILEEAENTADAARRVFGHAEFNLVHRCAERYTDDVLEQSAVYTSCAPCPRCLAAIASLGVRTVEGRAGPRRSWLRESARYWIFRGQCFLKRRSRGMRKATTLSLLRSEQDERRGQACG